MCFYCLVFSQNEKIRQEILKTTDPEGDEVRTIPFFWKGFQTMVKKKITHIESETPFENQIVELHFRNQTWW
jgi:hypothetical protein